MANPFVDSATLYTRTITDPRDKESWQVTFKPLAAGDRAILQDLTRMSTGDDQSAELRLGAMQVITVDRAVVQWTLPLAKTRLTIEALHPDLFDQIFEYVSWGTIPEDEEEKPGEENSPLPEPSEQSGELMLAADEPSF